jgi:hypothetical protein
MTTTVFSFFSVSNACDDFDLPQMELAYQVRELTRIEAVKEVSH